MRVLELFAGIAAPSVAARGLDIETVAFAEIELGPCKVLEHNYPDIQNLGDVTKITDDDIKALGPIDMVVGGSPCQDLSVAGKRAGLSGERSGLFFEQMRIFHAARHFCGARYLLWENVPGAFSTNKGRDFAEVVGAMAGVEFGVPDGGWRNTGVCVGDHGLVEWCVLDAQWFGVPQRRRRIFALLDTGDWASRPPILFDAESLRRNPPPRREAGQDVAPTVTGGPPFSRTGNERVECEAIVPVYPDVANPLTARMAKGMNTTLDEGQTPVVFEPRYARNGRGAPDTVCPPLKAQSGKTGKGDAAPVVAFSCKDYGADAGEVSPTLRSMAHKESHMNGGGQVAVAFKPSHYTRGKDGRPSDVTPPLSADADKGDQDTIIQAGYQVRRLTPRECERLQGFPDDYTAMLSDTQRYRALGNSMAVPVMRWIFKRILESIA